MCIYTVWKFEAFLATQILREIEVLRHNNETKLISSKIRVAENYSNFHTVYIPETYLCSAINISNISSLTFSISSCFIWCKSQPKTSFSFSRLPSYKWGMVSWNKQKISWNQFHVTFWEVRSFYNPFSKNHVIFSTVYRAEIKYLNLSTLWHVLQNFRESNALRKSKS